MKEVVPLRRELKKKATRDLLTQAALDLFSTQGYDETTVQQIAQVAGVAKGTFFNYFESKEDILRKIGAVQVEWALDELEDLLEEPAGPIAPRLVLFMSAMATRLHCTPPLMRAILQALLSEPSESPRAPTAGERLVEGLIPVFQAGQERGEFTTALPAGRLAALAMQTYFGVLLDWATATEPRPLGDLMTESVQVFLHGVKQPDEAHPV